MTHHLLPMAIGVCIFAGVMVEAPAAATPASGFTAAQQWKGVYPPFVINTRLRPEERQRRQVGLQRP